MKIQTKSGFVWDVDENRVKDWRFARHLAECDNESTAIFGVSKAVTFLMGEDGEAALMTHVTDQDGNIPTTRIIAEFREIMQFAGESIKKSQSSQE